MPRVLKVAILSTEYPPLSSGGLGTHVEELAAGLGRLGCCVYVFVYHPEWDRSISRGNVTICWFSGGSGTRGGDAMETLRWVNALAVARIESFFPAPEECPVIIHAHEWFWWLAGPQLRDFFRAPLVTTVHCPAQPVFQMTGRTLPPEMRAVEQQMYGGSDVLLAVSRFVQRTVKDMYGVDAKRCIVVHNGLDHERFVAASRGPLDPNLPATIFQADARRIVLFSGRLYAPEKGGLELLQSAVHVLDRAEAVVYACAGPHTPALRSVINGDSRLRGRVHLLGKLPRNQLAALYARAEIAVIPSVCESFPYAALEAMACGVPVVATDTGGIPEIVRHRETGILTPLVADHDSASHADVVQFAEAQLELLGNPGLRSLYGAAARTRVIDAFSASTMAERVMAVYSSIRPDAALHAGVWTQAAEAAP